MNMKTKLITLLVIAMASVNAMYAQTFNIKVGDIYYKFDTINQTAMASYRGMSYFYNNYSGDLTIPASVTYNEKSYRVVAIDGCAFFNCPNLTSLSMPNSIKSIGSGAFSNCSGLTSITIPDSVTSIGSEAFKYCSGLTSITIPDNVTRIEEYTFCNCSGLTSAVIGDSITVIGDYAFDGCSALTSVTIGNGVTDIGNYAFQNCPNIETLTLGNSLKSIGWKAFYGCTKLTNVELPNSLTTIRKEAFRDCSGLISIAIPDSVTIIELAAFQGCTGLTNVSFGKALWSIGPNAFDGCIGLTTVTLHEKIADIENKAFYGCTGLTSITCEAQTPPGMGADVFGACDNFTAFYIPCGTMQEYYYTNTWVKYRNFIKYPALEYTVTGEVNDTEAGSVVVPTTACDSLVVTAVPTDDTYIFVQWSDGNTDNPRSFELTQDTTFTAQFARNVRIITWQNDDSTILEIDTVIYGKYPTYYGPVPTKASTAEFRYFFKGWSPEIVPATVDATYTATYEASRITYMIKWFNYDHYLLSERYEEYGQIPEYKANPPTRPATAEFTYTFAGWDPEPVPVTGQAQYVATYTETRNSYTITWINYDGVILDQDTLEYGQLPAHEAPTKPATAQYTYIASWSPEIVNVTGNATYTVTLDSIVNKYTITFMNGEEELQSTEFEYGATPVYSGATPAKPEDAQYTYTFKGWDREIVDVTGDATYTATFTPTIRRYYVTFLLNDGSLWSYQDWEYGEMPSFEEDPPYIPTFETEEAELHYIYTFTGWQPELVPVVGEATYTATYSSTPRKYTIIFYDDDLTTVLCEDEWEYGTMPSCDAPSKEDEHFIYTFAGWTPEVVPAEWDAIYVATYTKTPKSEGFEDISSEDIAPRKVIIDSQIFILRGDKTYTLQGQEVK